MAQASNFTPDDLMNPVYCRQCRAHIPRIISQQNSSLCDDCVLANQQTQTIALQQHQAAQAQQRAAAIRANKKASHQRAWN